MALGLFNVIRRVGGNVGYALVTTMIISRPTVHRANLVEHVSLYHSNAMSRLGGAFGRLVDSGMSKAAAQASALRLLNETVQRQAMMLTFNDIFWIMAMLFVIGVPLVWLLGNRVRPRAAPASRSSL
jgi:DHA2 family multidrug resistance protein